MNTSHLAPRANPGGALPRRSFACLESTGIRFGRACARIGSHLRNLVLAGVCFLAVTHAIGAPVVTLAWDPNPEPDIAGYELSYGESPGNYSTSVNVGNNTTTDVTGLTQGQTYYFTVSAYNSDGLKSSPSQEISHTFVVVPTGALSLHYVDSEDTGGYMAEYAFDGDPNTFWHTKWRSDITPPPHEIQIALGSTQDISGFQYLPRQDNYLTGNVGQFEFYVSADGINWGSPVATGTFPATRDPKVVRFAKTSGSFIRFRGLTDSTGAIHMNVAEIGIIQDSDNQPANQAPTGTSNYLAVLEDSFLDFTLQGTDPDGNTLQFTVVSAPKYGVLSGTAPNLTYSPSANYNGTDSFTFIVNDGTVDSVPATVSITVTATNDAPIATAKFVTTEEDTPVTLILGGSDVDADSLSFFILAGPAHGTLTGTAPNVTYVPAANFSGVDTFSFHVSDGTVLSTPAVVSITVNAVNDLPVAQSKWVTTAENNQVSFKLSGTDVEGVPLTFTLLSGPTNGLLSGNIPDLTYYPPAGYNGIETVTFRVNDGQADSETGTISIVVTSVNDAPVAFSKLVTTAEDSSVVVMLAGTDAEKSPLSFTVLGGPTNGSLVGNPPNLSYLPAANFNGSDEFTFRVYDGEAYSETTTVSITVTPVNDAPLATSRSVSTTVDTPVAITLGGIDPDANSLTYTVVSTPSHGTLSGTAPNLNYSPAADFTGADQFTFLVNDGTLDSVPATVSITMAPVNLAPSFAANLIALTANERTTFAGQLLASDPNSDDVLTFQKISGPVWLTVSADGKLGGTPLKADIGTSSFIVSAIDPSNASASATLTITVSDTNGAPVFSVKPMVYPAGTEKSSYLGQSLASTAIDPDADDTVTYSKVAGPAWLVVASSGVLSGTPPRGSAGTNQFTVRATDTAGASDETTLQIKINANSLPLPWNLDRVGSGNIAGAATHSSTIFTVTGSGLIGSREDSGIIGWQTLSGNGKITARVSKLSDTGSNTRVGLMIRESLAANSRHVFFGVDGKGNYQWSHRLNTGGFITNSSKVPKPSTKIWVRLVRSSNVITVYQSANGTSWTKIGSSTVALPKNCYIGLWVCSGDNELLNSSQFSNVTVSP